MGKTKKKGKRRHPPARDGGVFRPRQRLIYRYHNGERTVAADPLALLRGLATRDDLVLDIDVKLAMGSSPEAPVALGRVVDGARRVFGVKPFSDTGGLTDAEVLALLADFGTWLQGVQRDAAPFVISPPFTEAASPPTTTEQPSASTSTSHAP